LFGISYVLFTVFISGVSLLVGFVFYATRSVCNLCIVFLIAPACAVVRCCASCFRCQHLFGYVLSVSCTSSLFGLAPLCSVFAVFFSARMLIVYYVCLFCFATVVALHVPSCLARGFMLEIDCLFCFATNLVDFAYEFPEYTVFAVSVLYSCTFLLFRLSVPSMFSVMGTFLSFGFGFLFQTLFVLSVSLLVLLFQVAYVGFVPFVFLGLLCLELFVCPLVLVALFAATAVGVWILFFLFIQSL
jgi:hypothetical protein